MLRLSKKTEYALMSVHLMAQEKAGITLSAHDIAGQCNIPEVLLSKILQTLRKQGMVHSTRGSQGGYSLARSPSEVSFLTFVEWFEERVSVVECADNGVTGCAQFHNCGVRSPLLNLNEKLHQWLNTVTLDQVFNKDVDSAYPLLEPVANSASGG